MERRCHRLQYHSRRETYADQVLGWASLIAAAGVSYYYAKQGIDERRRQQDVAGTRPTEKLDCPSRDLFSTARVTYPMKRLQGAQSWKRKRSKLRRRLNLKRPESRRDPKAPWPQLKPVRPPRRLPPISVRNQHRSVCYGVLPAQLF